MKVWEELKEEIRKIAKDKETARAILKMIEVRLDAVKRLDKESHTSIIVEDLYEIIKELITAIMLSEGYDADSHEAKIAYLGKSYKEFDDYEINLLDELRRIRNRINYKGFFVNKNYLERNELEIRNITQKLKEILEKKLE